MNRSTFNKAVVPGLFAIAVDSYKPKNVEQLWRQLCTVLPSTNAYEEAAYFAGLGKIPKKPEGRPIDYDDFVQGPSKMSLLKSNFEVIKKAISGKLLNLLRTIPRKGCYAY